MSEYVVAEDEAIVEAGRTEDVRLLRLRSNKKEQDMATVEEIVAETIAEKDKAMAEKDAQTTKAVEEKDAENVRLQSGGADWRSDRCVKCN